jgi:hypothetical protein
VIVTLAVLATSASKTTVFRTDMAFTSAVPRSKAYTHQDTHDRLGKARPHRVDAKRQLQLTAKEEPLHEADHRFGDTSSRVKRRRELWARRVRDGSELAPRRRGSPLTATADEIGSAAEIGARRLASIVLERARE